MQRYLNFLLLSLVAVSPALLAQRIDRPLHGAGRTWSDPSGMPSVMSPAPGDENWADLFGNGELDGDIFAMTPDAGGNGFYAGGSFRKAGRITLNGVARWDGTSWSIMGSTTQFGVDGVVHAIAVEGNDVYVGGRFRNAGGVAANNIARYNASTNTWTALGSGVGTGPADYVGSLAVRNGTLYAGGWFSQAGGTAANNIARWSGGSWSAFGSGASNGTDADVLALAIRIDTLFVGGSFSRAGGQTANSIVRWNIPSGSWTPIVERGENGLDGYVNAITVGRDAVYIGGSFWKLTRNLWPKPGGLDTTTNIIRWIDGEWAPLDATFDQALFNRQYAGERGVDNVVRCITINGDSIYVGGTFRRALPESMTHYSVSVPFIARWAWRPRNDQTSNVAWEMMQAGTNGYVNALASVGRNIFVGGSFRRAGDQNLSRIARWNIPTNSWSSLRSGPAGNLVAVGVRGSEVWAAGLMATSTGATGYRLARWNGTQWITVNTSTDGPIHAMAISGDDIYVGGMFNRAGTVGATNVARYNVPTDTWHSLGGSGVGGIGVTYVNAIAVSGSDVYVGGEFAIANDVAARSIARWDGTRWQRLGEGIAGQVAAIAVSGSDVYAGGKFATAGGVVARNIARWDGTGWNRLGSGVDDLVRAIAIGGSNVYVGGEFLTAGSVSSRAIAFWDGSAWNAMESGVSQGLFPLVNTIAVSGGSVYVAGKFERAGGASAGNIARWDGTRWNALGSGADGQVRSLAIGGTNLYAGGDFNRAGGRPSYRFGQWTAVPNIIRSDDDGSRGLAMRLLSGSAAANLARIAFSVPAEVADIRLTIHDASGRVVAVVVDDRIESGEHQVELDTSPLPVGTYYCRLRSEAGTTTTKLAVVR